jgi:hypothetical protein
MRNDNGTSSRVVTPTFRFRTPHSALPILFLVAACTPVTTRPDFRPDPRALIVTLDARPERVTAVLDSLVPAESLEVAHASVRDGHLETAWYDTRSHRTLHHEREITHLDATVKIRFWADPWVPGQTRLTVEPVYRPRYDPSRVERDLEVIVPKEHEGYTIAQRFVDNLKERFGVPKAAQEEGRPTPPPSPSPTPPSRRDRASRRDRVRSGGAW